MGALDQKPPDGTGSDTLRRYAYQAQVAVPYLLGCATGNGPIAVVVEHFEDLVLQFSDRLQFIQIKTRNQDLGPWRLASAMDGLRSLYRSYVALGLEHPSEYLLLLEGAVAKNDRLGELVGGQEPSESTVEVIAGALSIDQNACSTFLSSTRVVPGQPPRDFVVDRNLRVLAQSAPNASLEELAAIHDRVVQAILDAMALEGVLVHLVAFAEEPHSLEGDVLNAIRAKLFDQDHAKELFGDEVTIGSRLLERELDVSLPPPSTLERKMLAAGMSEAILSDARMLRASAAHRIAEYEALGVSASSDRIHDVLLRIRIEVNALTAAHHGDPSAGMAVWGVLLERLGASAEQIDQYKVFKRDRHLLLGAACEASDRCMFKWSIRDD